MAKKKAKFDDSKFLASEKEFINAINSFNLEKGTIAHQDKFFEMCNNFVKLPPNVDSDTIDHFLVILISLISIKPSEEATMNALQILFNYLK